MNDLGIIALKNGGFTIVDATFFPWLNRYSWWIDKDGHVISGQFGERHNTVSMASAIHQTPRGWLTDHKNGYPIDNFPYARPETPKPNGA